MRQSVALYSPIDRNCEHRCVVGSAEARHAYATSDEAAQKGGCSYFLETVAAKSAAHSASPKRWVADYVRADRGDDPQCMHAWI